jgi:hypothetical protein
VSARLAVVGVVLAAAVVAGDVARGTACGRPAPVVVAILDSGVNPVPPLATALDGTASVNLVEEEPPADVEGHGTAMASIIHRFAPQARLRSVKVVGTRGGSPADVATGIRTAVDSGADVVNLSAEGLAWDDPDLQGALAHARGNGVLVVAAAGNRGLDLDRSAPPPASVVLVTASDGGGRLLPASSFGATTVAGAAPGLDVPAVSAEGEPTSVTGTSAAAATVTGVVARTLQHRPSSSIEDAVRHLWRRTDTSPRLAGKVRSGTELAPPDDTC